MPYIKVNKSENLIEMFFLGRVSIAKHGYMAIDSWQWNPQKQCWYTSLTEGKIYSAKEKCKLTSDYEDETYLEVKLKSKDTSGRMYMFYIKKIDEDTYSVVSSNDFFQCSECNKMISVESKKCNNCGISSNYILKKYFNNFLNKQRLDSAYKQKLINSLKHNRSTAELQMLGSLTIDEIEAKIEKENKHFLIAHISEEYLRFHNYDKNDLETLNLWEINDIRMDECSFRTYRNAVSEEITQKAKEVFKKLIHYMLKK